VTGAVNYENNGTGPGSIVVRRDAAGIVSATGSLGIPGTSGGTSTVTVGIQRAWILPLWTGQISVRDQGAGVNVAAPVFGQIARGDTLTSARGTANWFVIGQFPNLIRPFSLSWSVTDGG
jgi:hypothetical protein